MSGGVSGCEPAGVRHFGPSTAGGKPDAAAPDGQAPNRSLLRTAISLASLFTAAGTAAAQEGGSSGLTLPTIDVTGDQGGSYQVSEPSLTRMPIPIIDTPQSVNVVPQQVIQDQNAGNVKDVLRNVAGISFRAGEGGNQGDTPYIRGFSAQSDVFRDGVRDAGWYTRDDFSTERVEVYKGPSSFLFGRGSTGGVVNIVTKTPYDRTSNEVTVSGNTGPGARVTVDSNAKINDNVSARIVTMGQLYDIPNRDHVEQNRWGIAPSLKMQVTDQTKVTLSYIYQHDQSIPDYGIPFTNPADGLPRSPAPVPHGNWYGILGGPNPDVERVDASIATAKIEHEINDHLKVTNTTRYADVLRYQLNVFPEPNTTVPLQSNLNTIWTPNRNSTAIHNTIAANQTDFLARFSTSGWEHTLVSGFDMQQERRDFLRQAWTGQAGTNFLDPDPYRFGGTPQPPTASQLTYGQSDAFGAYIADQIRLNRYFELLGGTRYDYFRFHQVAPVAAASVNDLTSVNNVMSWRVGGVFHPIANTSLYAMHGTSFNPSADNMTISVSTPATALSQFALPPEKNTTTEFGAKADVLGGRLSLAAAVFQIDKTNMRIPDATTSTVTVLNGVARSRGFEVSATGKLTDLWQIIASYSYIHARIIQSTIPLQVGAIPTNTPTNAFSLWSTYDVTPKYQIGGGAFYVGQVYGDIPTSATSIPQSGLVPDYWRFDAMMAYKFDEKTTLQLNIYNLTNKYYYESAYTNWAVPGAGRSVALTMKVKW
ncbi:MAG TPA: TonB-dependent siderophore receptor [Pseudolabrys sp.]|nr:TonB-dependent siderophore receptor [Pseudolabrys sp.]